MLVSFDSKIRILLDTEFIRISESGHLGNVPALITLRVLYRADIDAFTTPPDGASIKP